MALEREETLIGRYRLIEMIGSGGMADVWRGHDEVLDRPVAVKLATAAADPAHRSRLRAEARAYGRIASRHVAQVFDYGETDEQVPFLVMEYVAGMSLSDLARPVPWRQAVTIAAELADALRATHVRGLVHRDVKPDNVILTADGVKLVDFGISAAVGSCDADAAGHVLGTPGYVAPERLVDVPVDAAADVYALGVLLYRSLSGRLPWPHHTTTEALRCSLFEEPQPLPPIGGLPDTVIAACMACLSKDPHDRPTSAALATILSTAVGRAPAAIEDADPVTEARPQPPTSDPTRATPLATPTRRLTTLVSTDAFAAYRRPVILAVSGALLSALLLAAAWSANDQRVGAAPSTDAAISCLGRFEVTRDTGRILDANLSLTNVGADLTDWRASIALAGGTAELRAVAVVVEPTDGEPYPASTSLKDGTITVRGKETGTALGSDRGVVVPVRLSYSGRYPNPTGLALNGNTCQFSVSRPATDPAPPIATSAPPKQDGHHDNRKGKGHTGRG